MDIDLQVQDSTKQNTLDLIKDTLTACKGRRLRVRANLGRSKIAEYEGVVTEAHPQLFVMEVQRKRGSIERKSYQYVDILTETVILMQGDEKTPLFAVPFVTQQV
jgi:uncharacterized protein Veg